MKFPTGIKNLVTFFLCGILFFTAAAGVIKGSSINAKAANYDAEYRINRTLKVNGGQTFNIRTLHQYYDDNEYVSLRDFANALAGTGASFSLTVASDGVNMRTGGSYNSVGVENDYFKGLTRSQSEPEYVRKKNYFNLNGYNVQYYTILYDIGGVYDCYMYLTDLVLILEKEMWTEGDVLCIDTEKPLKINPQKLEAEDYFLGTNAVLIGDATTGEIYYSYNGAVGVSMASTTKLMTYLVVMDAITNGEIGMNDTVTMSANVNKLSYSVDGSIRIGTGSVATVNDLLGGMLLPSSNECALALAEYISGTEAAFADRMNKTAAKIGLSDETRFYNSNGLPTYTDGAFESKIQNYISAEDMFKLVAYIFAAYPQITDITAKTSIYLSSFGKTVYNTNPMLYNMNGVVGLKTGTTNRAGCCLVSAMAVKGSDGTHNLVAVEFGAEDVVTRNYISKTLLMYGRQVFNAGGVSSIEEYDPEIYNENIEPEVGVIDEGIPEDPEDLARLIVWTARNYLEIPVVDGDIEIPEDADGNN